MLERLGNVLWWFGILISIGLVMLVSLSAVNDTALSRNYLVATLFFVAALIPAIIGRAVKYILTGK